MKKGILPLFVCLLVIFGVFVYLQNAKTTPPSSSPSTAQTAPTDVPSISLSPQTTALFVPYWTLSFDFQESTYPTLLYFGITADKNGINKNDDGFKNLARFKSLSSGKKTLLVVRLLDRNTNELILNDKSLQEKIANQTVSLAKQNSFDGIVLDFEYSALAFGSVTSDITSFYNLFGQAARNSGLTFGEALYGDTFYRGRPYDVKEIAKNADAVYVLAYDFHKANGDPGPNFPLSATESDDYDLRAMTADFLKSVPTAKITVVFGMFGYDWPVDEKSRSSSQAESVTDNEVKQKFLNGCLLSNCQIVHDNNSSETKVTYIDGSGKNHIVWFEDQNSVAQKEKFLQTQGINSFAFWANSYF